MNQYVTGATIKSLREKRALTQSELASQLNVSDKAVSRWETGKGYPRHHSPRAPRPSPIYDLQRQRHIPVLQQGWPVQNPYSHDEAHCSKPLIQSTNALGK
ncbi:MAG: helix-turn-helix transcriptional regulator, partial [Eggerthellales bacterium]|nr:helix-turn-helix transcriptional regulator [Eggerthellales bacterium]